MDLDCLLPKERSEAGLFSRAANRRRNWGRNWRNAVGDLFVPRMHKPNLGFRQRKIDKANKNDAGESNDSNQSRKFGFVCFAADRQKADCKETDGKKSSSPIHRDSQCPLLAEQTVLFLQKGRLVDPNIIAHVGRGIDGSGVAARRDG